MEPYIFEKHKIRLTEIEKEHSIKILYAVESGSRAWGFESIDSDYDVRFIYCHQMDWYLSIIPKRDVIEYPIVDLFDYSGWDLKKTLFLMNKSNPVLFEWMKSPIVYFKNDQFFNILSECSKIYFSSVSSMHHYLSMATGNYRDFLQNDYVKIKKYFYALRPVLSCMWIEKNNETPPIVFEDLLKQDLNSDLIAEINVLLHKKRSSEELGLEPKNEIICNFIREKIQYFEKNASKYHSQEKPDTEFLDKKFIEILRKAW